MRQPITAEQVMMMLLDETHFAALKSRLRIKAFADKLSEMCEDDSYDGLSFEEKMIILIETEVNSRDDKRILANYKKAGFASPAACMEDIIYMPGRSLDRDRMERLTRCDYIRQADHLVIISESGSGKSFLAQALGNAACRSLFEVRYTRHADMCMELNVARTGGAVDYHRAMLDFISPALLIIDDFFTTPISDQNVIDTFEIVEARVDKGSMILASIIEPEEWHLRISTKTMADSLVDRIVQRAKFIDLRGPNMRKHLAQDTIEKS
ncbi:MAG: ATP-binding protein [Coriobacteriales bacterium]|nr:ATP-binding protein [Coriobacteriales bacterium]